MKTVDKPYLLYGLSYSYFTGKLEAYFRHKGLPYRLIETDARQYRVCSIATGVVQLPCVQAPDGSWLTDTTAIMKHFEAMESSPRIRPEDPATAFISLLLEDLFDEWYWRPALYYRWAFDEDARLLSGRLARAMFSHIRVPFFLRRLFLLNRQRVVYLKKDGVTRETGPLLEALYLESLSVLDEIFSRRPFLLGDRPCEADHGLFGPFFRHFFCDPTPGWLMRERAPYVTHWVTRMWSTRPADLIDEAPLNEVPEDLDFFFHMIAEDYFPYLGANSDAVASGQDLVRYQGQGVDWELPTAPYRAECFNELKLQYASLDATAADRVAKLLPVAAVEALQQPTIDVPKSVDRLGRIGRLG